MTEFRQGVREREAGSSWSSRKLRELIDEVIRSELVDFPAIEASVVWALRGSVLIGLLRSATSTTNQFWLIGGENIATDIAPVSVAKNPKEVARYFSLRWQIGVEQLLTLEDRTINNQSSHKRAGELRRMAESLYMLVETEGIW
jgi:hypothetical protein